ncbi:MAG: Omp28-related outer membrane protein, partial [Bacteroidetes bacterium]|nr:Omp28-related outer membrane protein [Bacteroidota bacterium]
TEPWWQGHAKWMNTVAEIVKQPSIVNIYVKPEINFETRELTVEVEYYYTDDSPVSKNYLTVMLLQNEIICYQAGWNHNQENVINDTLYRHNHALRKIITPGGAWGDTITNTKKGSYECRKYKVTLPDSIKDVPLDLTNLEIIAFIAESKANIYTGHKAIIEVPEDTKTDLALEDITEYYNTLKFETINPKIKVTNNSVLPITKFNIEYTLANNRNTQFNKDFFSKFYGKKIFDTFITKSDTYSGILNKGESVTIELPEITRDDFKASAYYIAQASFSNIYSDELFLLDTNPTNNTTKTTTKIGLIDTIFSEAEISFENPDTSSNNGFLPAHTVLDKSINPFFSLVQGTIGDLQQELNGAKNSKAAAVFYLDNEYFDVSFKPGYIVFGEIDCKDNPNKILSYYYAYSDYTMNGTRPKIIVEISKDWGKTWQKISEILCEETGKAEKFELRYIPTSEEYKLVQINLYDYAKENFIIRIGGVPGTFGDVLYIDEISITNTSNESIDENTNLLCYPNPATDIIHINNNNLLDKEYEIYDMSGKLIIK